MLTPHQVQVSKTLSYALRHRPDAFGLTLDAGGWTELTPLLTIMHERNVDTSKEEIEEIIANSDKKRFELDSGGNYIRATYGHSAIRIEFTPEEPPEVLYHGTSQRAYQKIDNEGSIKPMSRQYVHLSSDFDTALKVARRHDVCPVILIINTKKMSGEGFKFFHSANDGTWMCEQVPTKYICSTVLCQEAG